MTAPDPRSRSTAAAPWTRPAGPITAETDHAAAAARCAAIEADGGLPMWSLCERPADYAEGCTARLARTLPALEITDVVLLAPSIPGLIARVAHATGREWVVLGRNASDDPVIWGSLI